MVGLDRCCCVREEAKGSLNNTSLSLTRTAGIGGVEFGRDGSHKDLSLIIKRDYNFQDLDR